MSRIISFVSGKHVLAALFCLLVGGFFLFQTGPYPQLKERVNQAPLPEEQPMALSAIHHQLESLQAEGRKLYMTFQFWDFLNILLMFAFFSLFLAWLLQKLGKTETPMRWLVLIPTLLSSLDVFENLCLLSLTSQFPETSSLGALFPLLTAAKMLAFGLTLGILVWLGGWAVLRRWRRGPFRAAS